MLKIVFVGTKKGVVRKAAQARFGKAYHCFDTLKKHTASGRKRGK